MCFTAKCPSGESWGRVAVRDVNAVVQLIAAFDEGDYLRLHRLLG